MASNGLVTGVDVLATGGGSSRGGGGGSGSDDLIFFADVRFVGLLPGSVFLSPVHLSCHFGGGRTESRPFIFSAVPEVDFRNRVYFLSASRTFRFGSYGHVIRRSFSAWRRRRTQNYNRRSFT